MNILKGEIIAIQTYGSLSLVHLQLNEDVTWTTLLVETPDTAPYLKKNNKISLMFKETEVSLNKDTGPNISILNSVQGTIEDIEKSPLLSKLILNTSLGKIRSVLTTIAIDALQLKIGDQAIAMVKTNQIMVSQY